MNLQPSNWSNAHSSTSVFNTFQREMLSEHSSEFDEISKRIYQCQNIKIKRIERVYECMGFIALLNLEVVFAFFRSRMEGCIACFRRTCSRCRIPPAIQLQAKRSSSTALRRMQWRTLHATDSTGRTARTPRSMAWASISQRTPPTLPIQCIRPHLPAARTGDPQPSNPLSELAPSALTRAHQVHVRRARGGRGLPRRPAGPPGARSEARLRGAVQLHRRPAAEPVHLRHVSRCAGPARVPRDLLRLGGVRAQRPPGSLRLGLGRGGGRLLQLHRWRCHPARPDRAPSAARRTGQHGGSGAGAGAGRRRRAEAKAGGQDEASARPSRQEGDGAGGRGGKGSLALVHQVQMRAAGQRQHRCDAPGWPAPPGEGPLRNAGSCRGAGLGLPPET